MVPKNKTKSDPKSNQFLNLNSLKQKVPVTEAPITIPKISCDPNQFACHEDGGCIPKKWVCDDESDCGDGSGKLIIYEKKCINNSYK